MSAVLLADAKVYIGLITSKRERCPRTGCGAQMHVRADEHCIVWTCPQDHYSVKETSAGMRAAYLLSIKGIR